MDTGTTNPVERTRRADFQATSDPALTEGPATRGLLDYRQLYRLWERQQWATQDIDLTQDKVDWAESISDSERFERMYGFAAFFVGEQRVATELGPVMRACPREDMRVFLCTQIADEARHAAFFDRYMEECGLCLEPDMGGRLGEMDEHLNPDFTQLFDEMLRSRVDRLARDPEDLEALVETITLYHIVIEGMLALTGQHYTIVFNEWRGTLPGIVAGFENIARDEHRHVAFGVNFLRDMVALDRRYEEVVQRVLMETAVPAAGVMKPPWYDEEGGAERFEKTFGYSVAEAQEFAVNALQRRLAAIGIKPPG